MRFLRGITGVLLIGSSAAFAGSEQIAFPEGYGTSFVRYATVNKPDRDPPIIRFFYVNEEALGEAKTGEPLPYGTVIVMEDHPAVLDDQGQPIAAPNGDFMPTAEISNIFVQEKQEGWGADYAPDVRNGEWEYAWFLADGSPKPDAKFDRCFACHKEEVEAQDFNFTLSPFIATIKGQ